MRIPALVALIAVLVVPIACADERRTPVTPVTPVPRLPSASASDGAEPEPDRVVLLEKPWLPPWAGPNTPPEIAQRAGLRFCGVEQGPAIDVTIRNCFVDSVLAGRDIEFARIAPTTEGDSIATVFGFEPPAGFSMAVDSTQDRYGVPGWSITRCNRFIPNPVSVFELDVCESGPVLQ